MYNIFIILANIYETFPIKLTLQKKVILYSLIFMYNCSFIVHNPVHFPKFKISQQQYDDMTFLQGLAVAFKSKAEIKSK